MSDKRSEQIKGSGKYDATADKHSRPKVTFKGKICNNFNTKFCNFKGCPFLHVCKSFSHGEFRCEAKKSPTPAAPPPTTDGQKIKSKPSDWLELFNSRTPSTPINVDHLESELQNHPDQNFVQYLCKGLREGFDTFIPDTVFPYMECKNLLSARKKKKNPKDVQELIDKECLKDYLYGPFKSPPFTTYRVSPLGMAIGKYSGKKRLIVDLASPHEDPSHVSINELIKIHVVWLMSKLMVQLKVFVSMGKGFWWRRYMIYQTLSRIYLS